MSMLRSQTQRSVKRRASGQNKIARWLRLQPAVGTSIIILMVICLTALAAPVLTNIPPQSQNLIARLRPPVWAGGSWDFPLGTDQLGRDMVSRLFFGARVSLMVAIIATSLGLIVGTTLGILAGWYPERVIDNIIMYIVDVQLSLPFILLAIATALVLGNSLTVLIGLAALATWPTYARVCRSTVLSLRLRDFVVAAQALGAKDYYIIFRHILPGVIAPILVLATLNVGNVILLESALSFLGIGIRPPTPSWGTMIGEGREYIASAWWLAVLPGVMLMLLTLSVGIIGDFLRDHFDVTIHTKE
jgi:peptide/nickel transport system permease protein